MKKRKYNKRGSKAESSPSSDKQTSNNKDLRINIPQWGDFEKNCFNLNETSAALNWEFSPENFKKEENLDQTKISIPLEKENKFTVKDSFWSNEGELFDNEKIFGLDYSTSSPYSASQGHLDNIFSTNTTEYNFTNYF